MASENAGPDAPQPSESTSENTSAFTARRRGRPATVLPEPFIAVLDDYKAALQSAPLSDQTRRTYASKVRQFLAWLPDSDTAGDPLGEAAARDWAVRDYRAHLQAVLKRKPATVNNALAAIDDLYIRRGLGPASSATRAELPSSAPRALSKRAAVRFLRAVEASPSPRDQAITLIPFYAGTRIAEIASASTSTTSDGQPARASCASTAKARACARSRSTPSCARR